MPIGARAYARYVRLLLLVAVAAAVSAATATAGSARVDTTCKPGWTRALIGGRATCLRTGAPCRRALDRQYRRYRFHCVAGRLRRVAPAPPPAPLEVRATVAGPREIVFDWTTDRCDPEDIPDIGAKAIRDAAGRVHLYASHYVTRRSSGPTLNDVRHECAVVMGSRDDPRPSAYADKEWLGSVYTADGTTVHGLVHIEYQGHRHPGMCASGSYERCWHNAIGHAVSSDGGATFHAAPSPLHLVAAIPFPYAPDAGPVGMMDPNAIVRHPRDGFYYATVRQLPGPQFSSFRGTCLMRTRDLADPRSWRAWNGASWSTAFADPYRTTISDPSRHVCQPLFTGGFDLMGQSLTWNTYLERFVMVGSGNDGTSGGIYFSTSTNLLHWTAPKPILPVEFTYTHACGDPDPVAYPSLLDPDSPSRSFDVGGRRGYVYFTQFNYSACRMTLDRDLVRVPVEFTKRP